jgi:hypothetical protein
MSAGVSPGASLELPGPFALESGASLPSATVAFRTSLLDALGVRRLRLVVGGSLGGTQALEWFDANIPARFRRGIERDGGHGEASWVA